MQKLGIYEHYKQAYLFKEFPHKPNLTKEEYLREYNDILKIYESTYNWVFTNEFSQDIILDEYQKVVHNAFTKETSFSDKIKNICKSIKINYTNYDINLITKHPRYRLFMTLPYFLFNKKEISCQKYLSCDNCKSDETLLEFFLKLWEKNN